MLSVGQAERVRLMAEDAPLRERVLTRTVEFYLESRDFNGIPVRDLASSLDADQGTIVEALRALTAEGLTDLVSGRPHPNPHIKAFAAPEAAKQIEHAEERGWQQTCIYPSRTLLAERVPADLYRDSPYCRELALGAPQLDWHAFDTSVLEIYRNDPRYWYSIHDRGGSISISDAHFEDSDVREADRVLLKSFGFGFGEEMERVVVAYIYDLAVLSPEHQSIWKARQLSGEFDMHPEHYRSTILAEFPRLSLFEAFLMELKVINQQCAAMGRLPLFRKTWSQHDRPRGFSWIVRPTKRERLEFVSLLDKMLSENLNLAFFDGEVSLEKEAEREDGRIVVSRKGTIQLLADWLNKHFRPVDPEPIEQLMKTLRQVRKDRQKPAHSIVDDHFDKAIFEQQRQQMIQAYTAVRTIRLILHNHPLARSVAVREDLQKGEITNY